MSQGRMQGKKKKTSKKMMTKCEYKLSNVEVLPAFSFPVRAPALYVKYRSIYADVSVLPPNGLLFTPNLSSWCVPVSTVPYVHQGGGGCA